MMEKLTILFISYDMENTLTEIHVFLHVFLRVHKNQPTQKLIF